MSRMTEQKKVRKGFIEPPKPRRNFTPEEALELQEMVRTVNAQNWKVMLMKGNTALIPDGQKVAATEEAIARLLENAKNQYVSLKLSECGYENGSKVSINLHTGEITVNT